MSASEPVTVEVRLARAPYCVRVGGGILAACGGMIRALHAGNRVAVVTDANVAAIHLPVVMESLAAAGFEAVAITVEAGETSKRLECAGQVCDAMIAAGLDRSALLVALGGGVVGDLAGFVAAIYYRGIPCVQIPTTVVAQVDSSVGGKTGVNAPGGKNLIGAFHQPSLVIIDPLTLGTLPARDYNEGFAEIIKHAVIRDAEMLAVLDPGERAGLAGLIARNVRIKAAIVAADERETGGERALLNFGHTIGHAIEQAAGYGRFRHGEAVSIGLRGALLLSVHRAGLAQADCDRVVRVLEAFQLPVRVPEDLATADILRAMGRDKKFVGGKVRFVLTARLGSAFLASDVTTEEIEAVVGELRG
jgi:3-dehydroquinate synthase